MWKGNYKGRDATVPVLDLMIFPKFVTVSVRLWLCLRKEKGTHADEAILCFKSLNHSCICRNDDVTSFLVFLLWTVSALFIFLGFFLVMISIMVKLHKFLGVKNSVKIKKIKIIRFFLCKVMCLIILIYFLYKNFKIE